jgi:nitroimidazol reductase NimA-like FMN-containing flavoprotein (pyridoxamine 5'-phosphate oxidase superfamily)
MEHPALQILNDNRIMSIATVRPDGWPQTTIVGYANEGWRLYFLIYRTSQKFANISHDDRVSISVGHEPRELRDVKAVYAGCHAPKAGIVR